MEGLGREISMWILSPYECSGGYFDRAKIQENDHPGDAGIVALCDPLPAVESEKAAYPDSAT